MVATNKDATAHAERLAIELVCKREKSPVIPKYKLVSVFEPCLMCLSAAFWAGIKEVYYIIPASKYWDAISWVTESRTINKNKIIKQFSEKMILQHLNKYEKEFRQLFDKYVSRIISRDV